MAEHYSSWRDAHASIGDHHLHLTPHVLLSFVAQDKQAAPSENMEPGESTSLATDPSDGAPASRSGGELGDDGSKPAEPQAAAATVLVPKNSAKFPEGGSKIEGEVKQIGTPVTDEAPHAAVATNGGETPRKKSSGGDGGYGAAAAKEAAVAEEAAGSPSSKPSGTTEEAATDTRARTADGVSGGSSEPEHSATGTGGPVNAPSAGDVASPEAKPQEGSKAEAKKTPSPTASPKKVVTSGSGAALPAFLLAKELAPEAPLGSGAESPKAEASTGGVLSERRGTENSTPEGVGGAAAWEGIMSPTPPRTRSNPISRGTPPQRGNRGGNLAICTQQPYSPRGEGDRDWPKPSSPRSRPRDQPLVRAKNDARGGGGADGSGEDDDAAGATKEQVASFSSRRWKASDEYVLDEDR